MSRDATSSRDGLLFFTSPARRRSSASGGLETTLQLMALQGQGPSRLRGTQGRGPQTRQYPRAQGRCSQPFRAESHRGKREHTGGWSPSLERPDKVGLGSHTPGAHMGSAASCSHGCHSPRAHTGQAGKFLSGRPLGEQ